MNAAVNPERRLVLSYLPARKTGGLAALLSLDDALAHLLRTTTEPALGQIRLAWWREALAKLDHAPAPAEPVLQAIADHVVRAGVTGASLAPIVDGWETLLLAEVLDAESLASFGAARGTLFVAAGKVLGAKASAPLTEAGAGWALADVSRYLGVAEEAATARALAATSLASACQHRWSKPTRALGAMAHLARMDLTVPADQPIPFGAPRRVGRLLWHRFTGR